MPRQKRLPEAYSDQECRRLIAAFCHPVYRTGCALIYACGLRIMELLPLRPEQILTAQGALRIFGKGNKERLVPLPAFMLTALRQAWRQHRNPDWIFSASSAGPQLSRRTFYKAFSLAREAAGLPEEMTTHTLRHSYATRLLEKGVRPEIVRILLGHASLKTTQTYLHLTEPLRDDLRRILDGLMDGLC